MFSAALPITRSIGSTSCCPGDMLRLPELARISYAHPKRVSPDCLHHLSDVLCPLPRRIKWVHMSMASPNGRRVGIRIVTFEACSGFTHVTARRIAQPPKATFVARLQHCRLPDKAARQLPDISTTVWVEPCSPGDSRLRGARRRADISYLNLYPTARLSRTGRPLMLRPF
jgi:hypothetical protein